MTKVKTIAERPPVDTNGLVEYLREMVVETSTKFPTHDHVEIFVRIPHAHLDTYALTEHLRAYLEPLGGYVTSTHSGPDWDGVRPQDRRMEGDE